MNFVERKSRSVAGRWVPVPLFLNLTLVYVHTHKRDREVLLPGSPFSRRRRESKDVGFFKRGGDESIHKALVLDLAARNKTPEETHRPPLS
jgi:hypothetical protein